MGIEPTSSVDWTGFSPDWTFRYSAASKLLLMVPREEVESPCLSASEPKSGVSSQFHQRGIVWSRFILYGYRDTRVNLTWVKPAKPETLERDNGIEPF